MDEISENFSSYRTAIEASKKKLLDSILHSKEITLFHSHGNTGDTLIWEGENELLRDQKYKRIFMRSTKDVKKVQGHTAVISGGGAWCKSYHAMPSFLSEIEARFEKVIIFPSSFDPTVDVVKSALSKTKALVFARELDSYRLIRNLCNADYAYDSAFFFNYSSYKRSGQGILNAYRTDIDRKYDYLPADNLDISLKIKNIHKWLHYIANFETVNTDRAHVMIAAAMLGKRVFYRASQYHKVPGIAEFSLKEFPVYCQGK